MSRASLESNNVAMVDAARSGDAYALCRLLAASRPDLERYARRHCESEDVDEAVQDALWILHRKVGGLRSAAAFAGWLFQVVRRACIAYATRRRRHVPIHLLSGSAEPRACEIDVQLRLDLSRIIAGLPTRYRETLILKDIQGLAAEEVAAELSISVEAAKSRLHRARALVRSALATPAE